MSSEKQQRLVLSIINFLNQSIADGTVKADDRESLEVAVQCIGEAFGVDPSDSKQVEKLSVKPATLQSIFDVYLKTRDKVGSASNTSTQQKGPSGEDKVKAEELKQRGNALMSSKKFDEAIDSYTQAIALDPSNPIYYSNRAAAYSSKGDHLSAIGDAELALANDPKFVKAYHRLGHAQYCLSDFKAAADAFERGLKFDPNNAGLKSGLQNAKARITQDDDDDGPPPLIPDDGSTPAATSSRSGGNRGASSTPDLSTMADTLRGMGGGGGGMPDMASLLNNPQMMQMAQQMMANGGLAGLMQNPAVAEMMNRFQSGDMPSMEELMGNPALRNLAGQFAGRQ